MQLSFEAFDAINQRLAKVDNPQPEYLPTPEDIERYVQPAPEQYLEYLLWLTLTALPQDEDGLAALRKIKQILYREIIIRE